MFSDHETDFTEKGLRERGPCRTVHSLAFSVSVVWTALLVTQRLVHHAHVHLKAPHGLMLLACNGTGSQKADDRVTTDLKKLRPVSSKETPTYATGGAAVCPRPVPPAVNRFSDFIARLFGLFNGVLVL